MMKKLFGTVICGFVLTVQVLTAQSFEGKVIMGIEYEEVPEEIEPYIGMMPKEMIMYIKGDKSRSEQNVMGGETYTVMDKTTGKGFMVMDMMGQKNGFAMDMNDMSEKAEENDKAPEVKFFDDTKEIAGYKCKKATLKYDKNEEPVEVWYTEEISGGYNSNLKGIPGQPMEYTIKNGEIVMVVTVTTVSKESVDDSKFEAPKDVELKPYSDLKKMGMGGGH